MELRKKLTQLAEEVKSASRILAELSSDKKRKILNEVAVSFKRASRQIIKANQKDLLLAKRMKLTDANKIAEYANKAGFPPGVINVVHGSCGDLLVKHPDTHVVLFVGSNDVGSEIKKIVAGFHNKMCACEMGGKNALIVLDDANLDIAVNAAVISAFKTSGQRCTSASRFIVHEKVLSEFEKRFVGITKRMRIGNQ